MAVLYRKYRPKKFSEIFGQDHITSALKGALESGKVAHAYLFVGPKGTGKTTTARILAKALNCEVYSPRSTDYGKEKSGSRKSVDGSQHFGEPCGKCASCLAVEAGNHLDLIEIDAASNRSIDDVRDLREKIKLAPTSGRFKVYIVDEVHMLTTEAFNALLKTLEEPPAHAFFILCTTDASKVPPTIVSRTQRFNFKKGSVDELVAALKKVASAESIKIDEEALQAIAAASEGGYRDALSLLDQLSATGEAVTAQRARDLISAGSGDLAVKLVQKIFAKNLGEFFDLVGSLEEEGANFRRLTSDVLEFLRFVLLSANGVEIANYGYAQEATGTAKTVAQTDVIRLTTLLVDFDWQMRTTPIPSLPLELTAAEFVLGDREKLEFELEKEEVENGDGVKEESQRVKVEKQSEKSEEQRAKKISSEKAESKQQTAESGERTTENGEGSTDGGLTKVLDRWEAILSQIKPRNMSVVALLRGTKPIGFEGNVLTLEAFYKFHKERLEETKVISLIEEVAGEVLGERVRVVCKLGQKQAGTLDNAAPVNDDLAAAASEIFAN